MSLFGSNGWYCRAPDSGIEAVPWAELKALGFDAVALNVRDYPWEAWKTIVTRATAAGIACLPWGRTLIKAEVVSLTKLARGLQSRAVIVNAEGELLDGTVPPVWIAEQTLGLDACVSTLPWVGTPPVDLTPIAKLALHLQLFPQENEVSKQPRDCRAHAYAAGSQRASFMVGMHKLEPRSFPPLQRPAWLYTLDDAWKGGAGDLGEWEPIPRTFLTATTVPWTGPYYGPSHSRFGETKHKSKTAKALKLILTEAGMANFPASPSLYYNAELERAMRRLQRWARITVTGSYGKGSWVAIRELASANIGGTFACTPAAAELIRADAATP